MNKFLHRKKFFRLNIKHTNIYLFLNMFKLVLHSTGLPLYLEKWKNLEFAILEKKNWKTLELGNIEKKLEFCTKIFKKPGKT